MKFKVVQKSATAIELGISESSTRQTEPFQPVGSLKFGGPDKENIKKVIYQGLSTILNCENVAECSKLAMKLRVFSKFENAREEITRLTEMAISDHWKNLKIKAIK